MSKIQLDTFKLIGLALKKKTTNENGQSAIDCGNFWQEFEKGNYVAAIPGKLSNELFAVYHDYEGDHTQPYSYFIGCKVQMDTEVPAGMDSLIIPGTSYQKITANGVMPDCIGNAWQEIWRSGMPRAYQPDFEIYDERSHDWSNAEVDIFISVPNQI